MPVIKKNSTNKYKKIGDNHYSAYERESRAGRKIEYGADINTAKKIRNDR